MDIITNYKRFPGNTRLWPYPSALPKPFEYNGANTILIIKSKILNNSSKLPPNVADPITMILDIIPIVNALKQ